MSRSSEYVRRRLEEALERAASERLAESYDNGLAASWGDVEDLIEQALDKLKVNIA